GERPAVERHCRLAVAHEDFLAAEFHQCSSAGIEPGGATVRISAGSSTALPRQDKAEGEGRAAISRTFFRRLSRRGARRRGSACRRDLRSSAEGYDGRIEDGDHRAEG